MTGKNGFVRRICVEMVAADLTILLKEYCDNNITLEDVIFSDSLTVRMTIRKGDYNRVCSIAKQHGASCKMLRKVGVLWEISTIRYRPLLILGIVSFLLMTMLLPGRILHIQVEGNRDIPTQQILQQAEKAGIRFGCAARRIRSEQIKNQLLKEIPQLQWVGLNLRGCIAIIQVEERNRSIEPSNAGAVASIVAVRDGVISDVTVRNGTAMCTPGKSVQRGDVLISGYSDHGLKVTAAVADGEVFAHTRREIQLVSLISRTLQSKQNKITVYYRLRIGKKVINLSNHSGISDATCDKMYSEYCWALPGGFCLPISVMKQTSYSYDLQTVTEKESASMRLEADSRAYLLDQMIAGEILYATQSAKVSGDICRLNGIYSCREMIGKLRYEEILENYAENH